MAGQLIETNSVFFYASFQTGLMDSTASTTSASSTSLLTIWWCGPAATASWATIVSSNLIRPCVIKLQRLFIAKHSKINF